VRDCAKHSRDVWCVGSDRTRQLQQFVGRILLGREDIASPVYGFPGVEKAMLHGESERSRVFAKLVCHA
jgi:hypothetical protein